MMRSRWSSFREEELSSGLRNASSAGAVVNKIIRFVKKFCFFGEKHALIIYSSTDQIQATYQGRSSRSAAQARLRVWC